MGFTMLDLFLLSGTILATVLIILLTKQLLGETEIKRLRQRVNELSQELQEERAKYERLLSEAAIKNIMMQGLWRAFESGGVTKCIQDQGTVRVLADGTVLCDKKGELYAITK